jgi:UDP-glucose 4-epimerase
MRVVVTGGAGFIGSHVADRLLEAGNDVGVVDDLSTGSRDNVPAVARLEVVDVADSQAVSRVVDALRPELVCHLAAQASVTVSVRDPARDLEVNVRGTFNVLQAAQRVGARVVFASTGGALYGDGAPVPTPEDSVPPRPLAPYGASKLAAEAYVATWGRLHGIPNVVLRLGNVYGPRQTPHGEAGVVAIFSDRLLRGIRPVVYGDGRQTRDYVHVDDVAAAFLLAGERGEGTYNVGWGRERTVLELLDVLQRAADTRLEPVYEPLRAGELARSSLDSTRLRALGWEPAVELEEGLTATLETYR